MSEQLYKVNQVKIDEVRKQNIISNLRKKDRRVDIMSKLKSIYLVPTITLALLITVFNFGYYFYKSNSTLAMNNIVETQEGVFADITIPKGSYSVGDVITAKFNESYSLIDAFVITVHADEDDKIIAYHIITEEDVEALKDGDLVINIEVRLTNEEELKTTDEIKVEVHKVDDETTMEIIVKIEEDKIEDINEFVEKLSHVDEQEVLDFLVALPEDLSAEGVDLKSIHATAKELFFRYKDEYKHTWSDDEDDEEDDEDKEEKIEDIKELLEKLSHVKEANVLEFFDTLPEDLSAEGVDLKSIHAKAKELFFEYKDEYKHTWDDEDEDDDDDEDKEEKIEDIKELLEKLSHVKEDDVLEFIASLPKDLGAEGVDLKSIHTEAKELFFEYKDEYKHAWDDEDEDDDEYEDDDEDEDDDDEDDDDHDDEKEHENKGKGNKNKDDDDEDEDDE